RLTGATLYVTLEPCLMCFGALIHARVGRVVFGATDPKVGVSRWLETLDGAALNHRFSFEGGLLEPECRAQIQSFFKRRR
ncbi:MAG TPA: deaminase, partial [Geothrix sp.]|nr:deaminase [Geothrix sp.]